MNKQFVEDMVNAVKQDFENRKKARRPYENQWKLNMNFVVGDQYCDVTPLGNVEDYPKQYFWQEREVYNHIAPILETRLAKLGRKDGCSLCTGELASFESNYLPWFCNSKLLAKEPGK